MYVNKISIRVKEYLGSKSPWNTKIRQDEWTNHSILDCKAYPAIFDL